MPVIPPEDGFPVGAVVLAFTDMLGGSRGKVPWSDATVSRSAVIVSIDGVGSGTMGDSGVSTFIGWYGSVSPWAVCADAVEDSDDEESEVCVNLNVLRDNAWGC